MVESEIIEHGKLASMSSGDTGGAWRAMPPPALLSTNVL